MELHGAALRHTIPQQHTFMVNQLILKRNLGIKKASTNLEEACLMGYSGGLSKENRGRHSLNSGPDLPANQGRVNR